MRKRYAILGAVALCTVAVLVVGLAIAQEGGGRRSFDPAQMRQRTVDRIKEAVSPTEEEWKKLLPGVEKVVTLSSEPGVSGGMRGFGRRGGGAGEAEEPQTEIGKALRALQAAADDSTAKPEDIKAKLTAFRDARTKARQELAKAQEELRAAVNAKQEAKLLLAGVIE